LLKKISVALLVFGPFGILLASLIDSLGIPLPAAIDVWMLTIAAKEPQNAYFAALMAVLGSTGGNVALFMAARHGSRRFIKSEPSSPRVQKFHRWFHQYGMLTLFVPAVTPIVPLPLKVFVLSAGALRTPLSKFVIVILVARVIRYFGEAYLGLHLGSEAYGFLQRHAWALLGSATAAALGIYLIIRLSGARDESVL